MTAQAKGVVGGNIAVFTSLGFDFIVHNKQYLLKDRSKRTFSSPDQYVGETARSEATADVRKFSEYIFKDGAAPGKDIVYTNLGYGINDSETLTQLYMNQASAKYASNNYTLGKLTEYGQLINIEIELPGIGSAAGNTSYLKSGWIINPDDSIRLVTPFAGFTR